MLVSQMLQRIALCVLTCKECSPEEQNIAENILHSLLSQESVEDSKHLILCNTELSSSMEAVYRLRLFDTQSVQDMRYIPLWDILYEEIAREIDNVVERAAEASEEKAFFSTYWRYSHLIWANCLSHYPDNLLKGLIVLKQDLPLPLSWRLYKDQILSAQVYDTAPLGIIYRVLTQHIKEERPWECKTIKTTMRINTKNLPNSLNSEQEAEFSVRPNLLRFLSTLELYGRLKDCQRALRAENVLRSNQLILAEYEMTRPSSKLRQSNIQETRFFDLDDGDALLP